MKPSRGMQIPVATFLLDSFLLTMGLVNKMEGILKHGQITLLDSEMHPGKQQTLQVLFASPAHIMNDAKRMEGSDRAVRYFSQRLARKGVRKALTDDIM